MIEANRVKAVCTVGANHTWEWIRNVVGFNEYRADKYDPMNQYDGAVVEQKARIDDGRRRFLEVKTGNDKQSID